MPPASAALIKSTHTHKIWNVSSLETKIKTLSTAELQNSFCGDVGLQAVVAQSLDTPRISNFFDECIIAGRLDRKSLGVAFIPNALVDARGNVFAKNRSVLGKRQYDLTYIFPGHSWEQPSDRSLIETSLRGVEAGFSNFNFSGKSHRFDKVVSIVTRHRGLYHIMYDSAARLTLVSSLLQQHPNITVHISRAKHQDWHQKVSRPIFDMFGIRQAQLAYGMLHAHTLILSDFVGVKNARALFDFRKRLLSALPPSHGVGEGGRGGDGG